MPLKYRLMPEMFSPDGDGQDDTEDEPEDEIHIDDSHGGRSVKKSVLIDDRTGRVIVYFLDEVTSTIYVSGTSDMTVLSAIEEML